VLPPFINKLTLFIVLFFEKYTFNSAGRINLVSRGFLPYFQSNFTNKEYRFFTNGVDDIFINMHDNNVHPKTDKIRNEILYAGNIGAGQGLHKIIPSLASELKDKYYIKIIGDGGKLGKLKKETQKHKLDNVIFVKPMIREKLLEEYKNADILFLHLNDYLCFEKVLPSKLFEYAATGKPILAGLAGYSKEFLKNEIQNSESFRPNNHKEAIKALEKLNNTSTSRSYFIQKFSREKIITDMTSDIIEFVNKEKTD
jgi:glycosyltransferase involved in cell wall biosynthesis